MTTIMLCDNGSSKPQATLQLRELAKALSEKTNKTIFPVSLQHANRIPAGKINDEPAIIFVDFLRNQLQQDERNFIVVPLFFGYSKALSSFIPDQVAILKQEYGEFDLKVAEVIYPLPDGEPILHDIVLDYIHQSVEKTNNESKHIILVDHGSPIPQVTQVRSQLAETVQHQLPASYQLDQAVMERREGSEYDFNGDLLADVLEQKAASSIGEVSIILLFFFPGRHAGEGGDIVEICEQVQARHPGLQVHMSPLVAEHPRFIDILVDRINRLSNRLN